MSSCLTDAPDLAYLTATPVLIAASSKSAMARAQRTVEAFGHRVCAKLAIGEASNRIEGQARLGVIWVELDNDAGDRTDELLDRISTDVARGSYASVISAPSFLIDPIVARIRSDDVHLIIDADDSARAAALATASAQYRRPLQLSDIATDTNAERLRQLSDEVSRIASTLARLSTTPSVPRAPDVPVLGNPPTIPIEEIRKVIRARRMRDRYFPGEVFADPAWDMMLDLLQAEIAQLRVPVSSLCISAAVPATTALRWLKKLVSEGLFVRQNDPHDGRRVFVELAPETSTALRRYFVEVGQIAVV